MSKIQKRQSKQASWASKSNLLSAACELDPEAIVPQHKRNADTSKRLAQMQKCLALAHRTQSSVDLSIRITTLQASLDPNDEIRNFRLDKFHYSMLSREYNLVGEMHKQSEMDLQRSRTNRALSRRSCVSYDIGSNSMWQSSFTTAQSKRERLNAHDLLYDVHVDTILEPMDYKRNQEIPRTSLKRSFTNMCTDSSHSSSREKLKYFSDGAGSGSSADCLVSSREPYNPRTSVGNVSLVRGSKAVAYCPLLSKLDNLKQTLAGLCSGSTKHLLVQAEKCTQCAVPMVMMYRESMFSCPNCGRSTPGIATNSNNLPFGDEPEVSKHVYERRKNFRSWLNQWREGTRIPDDVLRRVIQVFTRLRIHSLREIRVTPVKEILGKLGLSAYSEYAQRITNQLTATPVPSLTQEDIEVFIKLFDIMQIPFLNVKDPARQSFPNGKYLTNKFCKIFGLHELIQCFPLLKSQENLRKQDAMFMKMCRSIGIEFERS